MRNAAWAVVLVAAALMEAPCGAATYPAKPVRVLAGGAAGGPIDMMARVVAQKMSDQFGQTIVIDNRGGTGGTIATRLAAQAAPGGYTLLCKSSQSPSPRGPTVSPGYDPFKDFAPIINAGTSPKMMFVNPSVPANNLQELIALGRTQKLSYGSAGAGSTPHLTGERLLKLLAKLDVTHIPYSSAAPAIQAVTGGQVPVGLTAMPPTRTHQGRKNSRYCGDEPRAHAFVAGRTHGWPSQDSRDMKTTHGSVFRRRARLRRSSNS